MTLTLALTLTPTNGQRTLRQTRAETAGLGDPGLRSMREGDVVQLERRGFFRADKPYRGEDKPLVLFMIPDGRTQAMSTLASTLKHV